MSNHKQPTPEELEAGIKAAAEAADKPDENPDDKKTGDEVSDDKKPEKKPDENPDDKKTGDEEDEKQKELEKLKKRQANSSRENYIIEQQNKKMAEALDQAASVPEPTEEELQAKFPTWDELSDFEKDLAKNKVWSDKRFAAIDEASKSFKNIKAWQTKVSDFVSDPKTLVDNPDLEGKEDEFRLYATQNEKRVNVDFQDLIAAFLYTYESKKTRSKGKMMETPSGGDKKPVKPASTKLSVAESERLRDTNYSEYRKQLQAGNIDDSIPD